VVVLSPLYITADELNAFAAREASIKKLAEKNGCEEADKKWSAKMALMEEELAALETEHARLLKENASLQVNVPRFFSFQSGWSMHRIVVVVLL
jgi:hypothetical protein